MGDIRVGLIGYGFSGAIFHAPFINRVDGLKLSKISTSNAWKVYRDFPETEVVPDSDALIRDPDLDLLVISSPNTTHFPLAAQALSAGKHVVVEKPFVNDSREGQELIRLAKEHGRMLSVYHNRRWDGDFLTVRKWMDSGILGDIHTFESHFDRYVPSVSTNWRDVDQPGSGMLFDLGAHLIDQALLLFGTPVSVYADLANQRKSSSTTDYFHLLLNYEKTKVILHSSMLMNKQGPRFQLHGTLGSYVKYGMDPQEAMLLRGMKPGDAGWGREEPEHYGAYSTVSGGLNLSGVVETVAGGYERYYEGIVEALNNGLPAPVSAEDALRVIKIMETAVQSNAEQRAIKVQ
jgi:scyllo-inositol 2-dehydrogenase (NADP+)